MRDDLIGLILGCGCRKLCCCDEPPAPAPEGGNLFQQAGRGTPPLRTPEETPFVPVIQSYDSPQRPGAWGSGFIPGVHPEPPPPRVFTHEVVGEAGNPPNPDPFFALEFQQAKGRARALPAGPVRVRATQGGIDPVMLSTRLYPGWTYAYDPYDNDSIGIYHPRGEVRETPGKLSPTGAAIPAITLEATHTITRPLVEFQDDLEWRVIGTRTLEVQVGSPYPEFDAVAQHWRETVVAGTWEEPLWEGTPTLVERRGPLRTANLYGLTVEETGYHEVISYVSVGGYEWKLAHRLADGTGRGVLLEVTPGRDPFPWGQYPCRYLNTLPFTRLASPAAPWLDRTWRSPDGEVSWRLATEGAPGTLSAYGHTLTGGTWAGLGGPVRIGEDGLPDFSGVLVLHEAGGDVTLIPSQGETETCPRSEFERRVLRCQPGAFQGFSPVGLGANVWPPQWAWAITGEDDARALSAWDAWRDSTRREWPGRPKRRPPPARPLTLPPDLRPRLGVTLATTGRVPRYEEPLLRWEDGHQQPPSHVPATVQVQRGGLWVDSPQALTALAKPALSPPASQAEALDDRTSVSGPLRVTWAGTAMPIGDRGYGMRAALLFRARAGREPPTLTVNGEPATVRPLGRNAGVRGWQPYLATWGASYSGVHASGLTVTPSAPLSRLLLTRIGLGEADDDGTTG